MSETTSASSMCECGHCFCQHNTAGQPKCCRCSFIQVKLSDFPATPRDEHAASSAETGGIPDHICGICYHPFDACSHCGATEGRATTWECGCGAFNGVNLSSCGVCTRPRAESRYR